MIDKINIDKTNAWPFVEAKKIIRERKKNIESKGKITHKIHGFNNSYRVEIYLP